MTEGRVEAEVFDYFQTLLNTGVNKVVVLKSKVSNNTGHGQTHFYLFFS